MHPERAAFIVDTDALTDDERIGACRVALDLLATEPATFESDIPWSMSDHWPPEVAEAAGHLQLISRRPRRDPTYGRTGVLQRRDDRAEAIVLRLTEPERAEMVAVVGPGRLVPISEWDARRRAARAERRRRLLRRLWAKVCRRA
ncbi:MAG: hypothetical protein ACRDWY_15225 [Actinomycetes bacterium]